MRKSIIYIAASSLLILAGCSKQLDNYPRSSAAPDGVSGNDLPAMRLGMYHTVELNPGQRSYNAFDICANDVKYSQTANSVDYIHEQLNILSGFVSGQWNGYFYSLYQVNNVLEVCENNADAADSRMCAGEAHYFRALIYLNMVTRWGGVPILKKNTMEKVARNSAEEVWAFIGEELDAAESMLGSSSSYYYVSQDAVIALKARYYLYTGRKSDAVKAAESLITSGKYALDSFEKIFNVDRSSNKETIFAFENRTDEDGLHVGNDFLTYAYTNKGGGWFLLTKEAAEMFEANDNRKSVSVIDVAGDKCICKFPGGQAYADPLIISRIAEMYLISAEAKGYPDGMGRLNELRKARGLSDATASSATFTDVILHERRLEFLGENHRYYDLVRCGKAMSVIGLQERELLWPVPSSQMLLNDLLKQNPGY